jgi:acyl-CoA synthetase (AMP-forming)/AMP-acid ligase II
MTLFTFDLAEEVVLGERMTVFAARPGSLRDVLADSLSYGDRDYLVEGDRRITYAEHHAAVASVAAYLKDTHGIGVNDRVAILGNNSLEWVVTWWAIVSLGAVAVALNAWWSADELAYAINDADPALLIVSEEMLDKAGTPGLPVIVMERDLQALIAAPGGAALPDTAIAEDDPATILYTSGTTGRAKGAVHTHRNLVGLVQVQAAITAAHVPPGFELPPARVFTTSPVFHVSGLHSGVVANLASGGTIVWQLGRFDPVAVMAAIARERCTSWSTVPTAVWRVVNHPEVASYDLTSLFHVGGGGAAFSPALQDRMREVFGETLSAGLGYGLTESGALATVASSDDLREHPTTVGRPVPTVEVEIRDADGDRVPDGEDGEICIRSPLVMLGYWRNPKATEETIRPGRWLRSGDLGLLDDGLLYLSTRRYDLIIRGGENVYPMEIENCLEGHDGVEECAVVGIPHEELGQEVCAVVVPRAGARLDAEGLTAYVRERLAYFKVPSRWQLRSEPLPRTASGKVVRPEILDWLLTVTGSSEGARTGH